MSTQAQIKANVKYNKSRDNIMIRPTKEEGAAIRQAAADSGLSVQKYILAAVRAYMKETPPN
jgi:predicted DNA binding CopG/RHH family protein